jgi:tetratricopeptide (TPR) repeat protein
MADSRRIEDLKRRVQLDPASIAFAALAEEYRRARQFEAAIATCRAGLQRHPAYLSARVTLGRSLLELERYDEARHELEHVLRVAPENLAAIRALAEIHSRHGEALEADPLAAAAAPDPTPPELPEPPPITAPPVPVPVRPVRLSIVTSPPPSAHPAPTPELPAPPPPARPQPPTTLSIVPPRVSHPDEAALPKLEAFLAAIVRARESLRPERPADR